MADDRTNREAADDLVQRVQGNNVTWIEIASTGGEDEARLLQGFLEAEGIPAQIESVEFHEMPTTFGGLGDIRIYVSSEDEARAQELLRKRQTEYEQLDDDDDTLVTDDGPAEIDENAQAEAEPEET
jgi:Putative prokaryotic signal transducing protein